MSKTKLNKTASALLELQDMIEKKAQQKKQQATNKDAADKATGKPGADMDQESSPDAPIDKNKVKPDNVKVVPEQKEDKDEDQPQKSAEEIGRELINEIKKASEGPSNPVENATGKPGADLKQESVPEAAIDKNSVKPETVAQGTCQEADKDKDRPAKTQSAREKAQAQKIQAEKALAEQTQAEKEQEQAEKSQAAKNVTAVDIQQKIASYEVGRRAAIAFIKAAGSFDAAPEASKDPVEMSKQQGRQDYEILIQKAQEQLRLQKQAQDEQYQEELGKIAYDEQVKEAAFQEALDIIQQQEDAIQEMSYKIQSYEALIQEAQQTIQTKQQAEDRTSLVGEVTESVVRALQSAANAHHG